MAIKRLPDSEFEIMEIIWDNPSPITTLQVMEKLNPGRQIKMQTLLTMLIRLIEKGFLTSERVGRDRSFSPLVDRQDYMLIESEGFITRHYISSIGSLLQTFYNGREISQDELKELKAWLTERGKVKME